MRDNNFFKQLIESGQFFVDESGHLVVFNEFILLIPIIDVIKLRELLINEIGKKKANEIFVKIGEYQVEAAAKRYIKKFNFQNIDKIKITKFTSEIINNLGWGRFEIKKMLFEEKRATAILRNSAMAIKYKLLYKENSKEPIDYWFAGILKKHFSVIFGKKIEVKEVKCMAMGDSHCEFVISPKN